MPIEPQSIDMTKMKISFAAIAVLYSFALSAQFQYQNYDWGKPKAFVPDSGSASKVVILKKEICEFGFENAMFLQVNMFHSIEYLGTEKAVEDNNRKYMGFTNTSIIMDPMARVILPDGSVIVLDESKILEAKDEATGNHYKYFAFEGVEPGSVIEYAYVLKSAPVYTGRQKYIQADAPVLRYEFDLFAPASMQFSMKTYKLGSNFTFSQVGSKNKWSLAADSLPAILPEFQAPLENLYAQFAFRLDSYSGESEVSSFSKASQSVYSQMSEPADRSDEKALKRIIKESGITKNTPEEEIIKHIEYFLKTSYRVVDHSGLQLNKPSEIVKNKLASHAGITKLYFMLFRRLGIETEIVLTCDRTKYPFDPSFEAYHFLTQYLMYFPKWDKFISPSDFAYRFGLIPYEYTDTYGLFVSERRIGNLSAGVGRVRKIPATPYSHTNSSMDINIRIDSAASDAIVCINSKASGYYAVYLQPYLELMNAEQWKNYVESEIQRIIPASSIQHYTLKNGKGLDVGHKPMEIEYCLENTGILSYAAGRYLINIGATIAPQLELYDTASRKLPVYSSYKRMYERTITLEIPQGYRVANPADSEIISEYGQAGNVSISFKSSWQQAEGSITVKAVEFYDQLWFEPSEYQFYREVINSAADFNKLTFIIEPIVE
jgi:hypothetical protein